MVLEGALFYNIRRFKMSVIVHTTITIILLFIAHGRILRATTGIRHKIALWYGYLMYSVVAAACATGCWYGWKYANLWKGDIDMMIFLGITSIVCLVTMKKED